MVWPTVASLGALTWGTVLCELPADPAKDSNSFIVILNSFILPFLGSDANSAFGETSGNKLLGLNGLSPLLGLPHAMFLGPS